MSDTNNLASPLLTPEQAGDLLHLHPRTLANWRWAGKGPRYVRLGARACYRQSDLDAWIDQQAFTNTAQEAARRAGRSPRTAPRI